MELRARKVVQAPVAAEIANVPRTTIAMAAADAAVVASLLSQRNTSFLLLMIASVAAVEHHLQMRAPGSSLMYKHAATAARELVFVLPSASLVAVAGPVPAVMEAATVPKTTAVMVAATVAAIRRR